MASRILQWLTMLEGSYSLLAVAVLGLGTLTYLYLREDRLYSHIPVLGVDEHAWFKIEKARTNYLVHGQRLVKEGLKKFSGPFQVVTGTGPMVLLPARYADEIRNNRSLSFSKAVKKELFANYPGFEPLSVGENGNAHEEDVLPSVVRGNITQSLNLITDDLSDETSIALRALFGESDEWREVPLMKLVLPLIAQISARVFVGPELCRNPEWLKISIMYTVDVFMAARALRKWPFLVRPFVHWFLPECKKLRQDVRDARRVMTPIVERRLADNREAAARGEKLAKTEDTIGWMNAAAQKAGMRLDVATAQVGLSTAAVHTTSKLVTGAMMDFLTVPGFIDEIREEMKTVLEEDSWKKTSLYKMKLLDSALKETQRYHTTDVATMRRMADQPVQLSDGTIIPKGAIVMVSVDNFFNPAIYPDPESYKPHRFLDMRRQPGNENRWQLVSTSPEHLGFGHGQHACPGRFFAANEVKVALCHMLLKYDWKMDGEKGIPRDLNELAANPNAKVWVRRRKEEVPL